jgi:hypothetical protein
MVGKGVRLPGWFERVAFGAVWRRGIGGHLTAASWKRTGSDRKYTLAAPSAAGKNNAASVEERALARTSHARASKASCGLVRRKNGAQRAPFQIGLPPAANHLN